MSAVKDGFKGCVRSPEMRAKISAARKGIPVSAEARARIGAASRGRKQSAESIEKRAAAMRGKVRGPRLPEYVEKVAAQLRGRPLSDGHKAKIATANRGRPKQPDHVEKIRATHLARHAEICNAPKIPKNIAVRKKWLKKKYGLELADYQRMFDEQGGRCAICRAEPTGKGLHVDHCHKTGKTRALLCLGCNVLLGGAKDSADTLRAAIAYLGKHC